MEGVKYDHAEASTENVWVLSDSNGSVIQFAEAFLATPGMFTI